MRVAMVSEHASPLACMGGVDAGGQNVHVAALATYLARRGVEVVVHTRRDDPDLPDQVELPGGVVVDHVPAGPAAVLPKDDLLEHMPTFAACLRRAWQRERPDVVHSHFWMSGLASLDAAWPLGIPVAHTFHALGVVKRRHQGDADTSPAERDAVERRLVAEADRVIATCSDEVFELRRLGADRNALTVVPCGVDVDRFTPARELPDGDPVVLVAARLVPRKGIEDAVRALAHLPEAVRLEVIGGPDASELDADPEARRLRAIAEELGVAGRLRLLGRVGRDAMPAAFRRAWVVACPAHYEPFGIVPLEAMASGVPIVATAVGGHVDSVVDGSTGLHVPPEDPEALAGALGALIADPERRRRMGEIGARRARRRFAWERVAHATHDVYQELAGVQLARRRAARL